LICGIPRDFPLVVKCRPHSPLPDKSNELFVFLASDQFRVWVGSTAVPHVEELLKASFPVPGAPPFLRQ
jgi:hypothetical protein